MTELEQTPSRDQTAIEKVLLETVKENRRQRRWRIFFKLVYLLIFVFIILLLFAGKGITEGTFFKSHIALIKINGTIDSNSDASAENIIKSLNEAFDSPNVQGIILQMNSPGGSPVQAAQIFDEIIYLKNQNPDIKVIAV